MRKREPCKWCGREKCGSKYPVRQTRACMAEELSRRRLGEAFSQDTSLPADRCILCVDTIGNLLGADLHDEYLEFKKTMRGTRGWRVLAHFIAQKFESCADCRERLVKLERDPIRAFVARVNGRAEVDIHDHWTIAGAYYRAFQAESALVLGEERGTDADLKKRAAELRASVEAELAAVIDRADKEQFSLCTSCQRADDCPQEREESYWPVSTMTEHGNVIVCHDYDGDGGDGK